MVQFILRKATRIFIKPLVSNYLKKDRDYSYNGIKIKVLSGVFHPGLFFSTKFLLRWLSKENLTGKKLLEPGAGSGIISVFAVKQGAKVTATDISKKAIENCKINAEMNNVEMGIIFSDLFSAIPPQKFDYIILNPPYYKGNPRTEREQAWYCGENFEYFEKLFLGITVFMHPQTKALLILSDGCDINHIKHIAAKNNLTLYQVEKHNNLIETNFLYLINTLGANLVL